MLRLTLILCLALLVSGCGIAAKVTAREDMQNSKAAYKACLAANPDNPDKCEAQRRAYEADIKAYRETSKGIRPGGVVSVEE
jgi:hypothetical protein